LFCDFCCGFFESYYSLKQKKMAPSWIPLMRTMQRYCEAYFTAVERWRNYDDLELIKNRILLIETVSESPS
jgi:hypothetical protein